MILLAGHAIFSLSTILILPFKVTVLKDTKLKYPYEICSQTCKLNGMSITFGQSHMPVQALKLPCNFDTDATLGVSYSVLTVTTINTMNKYNELYFIRHLLYLFAHCSP